MERLRQFHNKPNDELFGEPHDVLELSDDLVFHIKIEGETWDGAVDYRGAKYVLALQNAVNRIYKELDPDTKSLRNLSKQVTVKVRVEDGSTELLIEMKEAIFTMISKLSGKQATLVMSLAILCATGYFTNNKILDYKKDVLILKQQELVAQEQRLTATEIAQQMTRMTETLSEPINRVISLVQSADLEKPSRQIVNAMEEDDRVQFPDRTELTKAQAKKRYPRKQRLTKEFCYCDDVWTITKIDVDVSPPVFTIHNNGVTLRAVVELLPHHISSLTDQLAEAINAGKEFQMPLRVFVTYTKREIKAATIQGIGEKRDEAVNIADIAANLSL